MVFQLDRLWSGLRGVKARDLDSAKDAPEIEPGVLGSRGEAATCGKRS